MNREDNQVGRSTACANVFTRTFSHHPDFLWITQERVSVPSLLSPYLTDTFGPEPLGLFSSLRGEEALNRALDYDDDSLWRLFQDCLGYAVEGESHFEKMRDFVLQSYANAYHTFLTGDDEDRSLEEGKELIRKITRSLWRRSLFRKWVAAISEFKIEVWDLRSGNVGVSQLDGRLVILDSSIGLSDV